MFRTTAFNQENTIHRNRIAVITCACLLVGLVYGPFASWFMPVERFVYDTFAEHFRANTLENTTIITVDSSRKTEEQLLNEFGDLIQTLKDEAAARIILANPPEIDNEIPLNLWVAILDGEIPIVVPEHHQLAAYTDHTGVFFLQTDPDQVLRKSRLWHLDDGAMKPALALAVALTRPNFVVDRRLSFSDFEIYHSKYSPVSYLTAKQVMSQSFPVTQFAGQTIFIDSTPQSISSNTALPSGQYVTPSEITAQLVADIETGKTIVSPPWIRVVEVVIPIFLAIIAGIVLPNRGRRDIISITVIGIIVIVLCEALLLLIGRIHLDLGRTILVILGASILSWLVVGSKNESATNAFKRGNDFLASGWLEPAFAEFRRCTPTESVVSAMYKLSLAFEEQSKPERAEAVIQWMNKINSGTVSPEKKFTLTRKKGTPQKLGRYVIERELGSGAMGAVYLARDPRINRPLALKVIPIEEEFGEDRLEEVQDRFFREAESAGRLSHPNIITVYDCGEEQHMAYIAMEYLQGIPLTDFTDANKLLDVKKTLELCARTAEALDYAHNQGVIHRDIKPANLLYSLRQDVLKISDFGVARLTDINRTNTGIVLGTPMYMSPEQLGAEKLTGHSDLFSLGVTLYELLIGEVPFTASNIRVLMTKITSEDPPPISNRRPGIPPSVDVALNKALAKKPEDRFLNGADMAAALRNCAKYAA